MADDAAAVDAGISKETHDRVSNELVSQPKGDDGDARGHRRVHFCRGVQRPRQVIQVEWIRLDCDDTGISVPQKFGRACANVGPNFKKQTALGTIGDGRMP